MPTALDNGRRSPRKLLRTVVARLVGARTFRKLERSWDQPVGDLSRLDYCCP
jgi:hypothetical protein